MLSRVLPRIAQDAGTLCDHLTGPGTVWAACDTCLREPCSPARRSRVLCPCDLSAAQCNSLNPAKGINRETVSWHPSSRASVVQWSCFVLARVSTTSTPRHLQANSPGVSRSPWSFPFGVRNVVHRIRCGLCGEYITIVETWRITGQFQ